MYAWYFPKGFWGWYPSRRHDWASAMLWIDNPDVAKPKVLNLAGSSSDTEYIALQWRFDGTSLELSRLMGPTQRGPFSNSGQPVMNGGGNGKPSSLIMWDQLTDEARSTLNTYDFGDCKVPFNDANFDANLNKSWFDP